jgi:hypothetical protein
MPAGFVQPVIVEKSTAVKLFVYPYRKLNAYGYDQFAIPTV